jgi:hypothetical protein
MTETSDRNRDAIAVATGVVSALEAVTFFIGALLHLGVGIPLGFVVLEEPPIFPAVVVESLCGLFLGVAAYAVLTRKSWAWPAAVAGHAFALGGVLLGVTAIALGGGPDTTLNHVYHRVMLVVLGAVLVVLATPSGRNALGRGPGDREGIVS